jgi:hypothetical protein
MLAYGWGCRVGWGRLRWPKNSLDVSGGDVVRGHHVDLGRVDVPELLEQVRWMTASGRLVASEFRMC